MSSRLLVVLITATAFLFTSHSVSSAKDIYVNCKASGEVVDGASWQTAFRTVGEGLGAAVSGDRVLVAVGTYAEQIVLPAGVQLYGSFSGVETAGETVNLTPSGCVLDGAGKGVVATIAEGADASTVIDGFTIQNGKGKLISTEDWTFTGGGIVCINASPTISNCIVKNNDGGGIYCSGGSPVIRNNTVDANDGRVNDSGGIVCIDGSPQISGNTVSRNDVYASDYTEGGGGIVCRGGRPVIDGNEISNNTVGGYMSATGGGIDCRCEYAAITNNLISDNDAYHEYRGSDWGGGIFCTGAALIEGNTFTGNHPCGVQSRNDQSCIIKNNRFLNSETGIYTTYSKVSGNYVSGNWTGIQGGDVTGNTVFCNETGITTSLLISNNIVVGNTYGVRGNNITNNTVVHNGSGVTGLAGALVSNNIIAYNGRGVQAYYRENLPVLRNNCVSENEKFNYSPDVIPGEGDITSSPRVCGSGYGEFHLRPDSPCINKGWSEAVGIAEFDIDGKARVMGTSVDIGADEFDGKRWRIPGVVYVSPHGSDKNDGRSWKRAKRTIQAAVDAAQPGGDIWVAAGTYKGSVTLRPYVYLYGGFSGKETSFSQRDCKKKASIIEAPGKTAITVQNAGVMSTVDGISVRKATNGIACFYSSPPIVNNTITDCKDSAIYTWGTRDQLIESNYISRNGLGIGCQGRKTLIQNNEISRNSSGGIKCYEYASVTIKNNRLAANRAERGGAICAVNDSSAHILDNEIVGNRAEYGGGIYSSDAYTDTIGNMIAGNVATYGGGVYCVGETYDLWPIMINNRILRNYAEYGGGIYNTSAGRVGDLGLYDSVIAGNVASKLGGGIYCGSGSYAYIQNNTIASNYAGVDGGAYYIKKPSWGNGNCRFWCNIAAFNSSGICGQISEGGLNCVYGNRQYDYKDGVQFDTDFQADPLFRNLWKGDFHLQAGSPCIDAVPVEMGSGGLDMDGQQRNYNGVADVGADEYWPEN